MTEDKMVERHHRLNGHVFGWTPGVGNGQGGLGCCSSWGCRVGHDRATELKSLLKKGLATHSHILACRTPWT